MPELPEVETLIRSLSPRLKGFEVRGFKIFRRGVLRNEDLSLLHKLKGQKIVYIRRRGKMILIDCEGNLSLIIHLKMTGQLIFYSKDEPLDKHTHFVLFFKGQSQELRFRDVRKFGFISCRRTSDLDSAAELRQLGPEPLEVDFPSFCRLFQGRTARLKSLLLNQSFLAGIGNIYSDEILFEAKVHPLAPASCLGEKELKLLWRAIRSVLERAIRYRGSTIRDFTDAEGHKGGFQNRHQVYGRESLPCFVCQASIMRFRLGGRSSFFCPECQKIRY
jgi:formamidopyrimidine-DNA glycosylase